MAGSMLCLVAHVSFPGRPAALRRRASSKAKRTTRAEPSSVMTLRAKRPGPKSATGRRAIGLESASGPSAARSPSTPT